MAGWVTGGYPGGSVQVESGPVFTWRQGICKLVLHTTETAGFPDYPSGNAPHVTISPSRKQWRQHQPLDKPAWALAAPVGSVSTNSMGAIQIEIVGYAQSVKDLSGDDLAYLIGFIRFILAQTGIPAVCTVPFDGGAAYGTNGSVRLSSSAWTNYRGILGHQHVPGNSHWDPGDLPMQAKWLPLIQGVEDDMTPEEHMMLKELFDRRGKIDNTENKVEEIHAGVGILDTKVNKIPTTSVVVDAAVVAEAVTAALLESGVNLSPEAATGIAQKTVELMPKTLS